VRADGSCTTDPARTVHSATPTCQRNAAACTRTARAVAPRRREAAKLVLMPELPEVE